MAASKFLRWLLRIFCVISASIGFFLPPTASQRCKRICGRLKEQEDAREIIRKNELEHGLEDKDDKSVKGRIVNGYTPRHNRGPLVLIHKHNDRHEHEGTCTGTVLNSRFVLTAAHCVCLSKEVHPGTPVDCIDGKPTYPPTKMFRIYFAVNKVSVLNIGKWGAYKKVAHIDIHDSWKGDGNGVDLAILKIRDQDMLRWRLRDRSNQLLPLCLPNTMLFRTYDQPVYTAGWGLSYRPVCLTDNRGPVRNVKCRYPYDFVQYGYMEEREGCSFDDSPSQWNPRCQQFAGNHPGFDWSSVEHVEIRYNLGKSKTKCYPPSSKHGWCGVCLPNAKQGKAGFCPQNMIDNHGWTRDEDGPNTRVRWSKNWGFCSKDCDNPHKKTENLQETQLSVLKIRDCLVLNSTTISYQPDREFCTGLKHTFPKYQIYERNFVGKQHDENGNLKNVYRHKWIGENTTYLDSKEEHRVLDYYIGFSDSCAGDSGGPLYQFVEIPGHGKRAFLVGVVSRGGDCAGFNTPGVYTSLRDKQNLRWVNSIIWKQNDGKKIRC